MRIRIVLAIILLGVGLCFVPAVGYGEVRHMWNEAKATLMEIALLEARVDYMMRNPDVFLDVGFYYDPTGEIEMEAPVDIDTKGKICIWVQDNNRAGFSYKSGTALLDLFKACLDVLYAFIETKGVVTDINTDVVAKFYSRESIPLGYFYQGEYHLWQR